MSQTSNRRRCHSCDGRRLLADDATNHPASTLERLLGSLAIDAELAHHDRKLDALVACFEEPTSFDTVDGAHFHHDPLAPVLELQVRRPEIDHQVAVRLAEPDHRAGG